MLVLGVKHSGPDKFWEFKFSVDQLCINMKENFDYRTLALVGIMFMA